MQTKWDNKREQIALQKSSNEQYKYFKKVFLLNIVGLFLSICTIPIMISACIYSLNNLGALILAIGFTTALIAIALNYIYETIRIHKIVKNVTQSPSSPPQ